MVASSSALLELNHGELNLGPPRLLTGKPLCFHTFYVDYFKFKFTLNLLQITKTEITTQWEEWEEENHGLKVTRTLVAGFGSFGNVKVK